MKNFIAIEWLKVKTYRTFWILCGFFIVLLPLWNYTIANGIMKIGDGKINLVNQAYSFSYVWQNMGYWTSIFVAFISILVIILTTNEYQFRTNRQNVIDGWTRLSFYHAKWQVVLVLSFLTTIYVFFIGIAFGMAYGSGSGFPGNIHYLFYVWALVFNYYSFGLLLSLFFKRSGITIGMFLLYSMIIESLAVKIINWSFDTKAGNFMPLQCSDELLPFPILDMFKAMAKMQDNVSPNAYVVATFIWIAIYYLIGRIKLTRNDW